MLTASLFLVSDTHLAPIAIFWFLGVALIVSLFLINHRRIRSHDDDV